MPETESYIFEPEGRPVHTYRVDAAGLTYCPPGRESITVRWEEIKYLEDVSGQKVDIVINGTPKAIPLFYATRNFTALLAAVCAPLARLHREKIEVQTFRGHTSYFVHIGIVLGIFAILILISTLYLHRFTAAWLFILATAVPMTVYLLLQPHTVTPGDDHLVVRDFVHTRFIDYAHIRELAFDLHGDQHIAYLCLRIHLTDGRKIKMQRFENLILLYIFLKTKWDRARTTT